MGPRLLAATVLLSALTGAHGPTTVLKERVGNWSLVATRDAFRGEARCRLSRGHVVYQRSALVFQLSRHLDTFDAIYRVDGREPVHVREDSAELAQLGFALHQNNLANPSGGIVRIPLGRLDNAKEVEIQARPGKLPVLLAVDGLGAALTSAQGAGCTEASFY
jgi:hypothetical protein